MVPFPPLPNSRTVQDTDEREVARKATTCPCAAGLLGVPPGGILPDRVHPTVARPPGIQTEPCGMSVVLEGLNAEWAWSSRENHLQTATGQAEHAYFPLHMLLQFS